MSQQWGRLAETVKRRRLELRLSQRAAADRARVSPTTWGSLEKHANPVDELSRVAISRALGWEAHSADDVLAGGEPTVDVDYRPEPTVSELDLRLADLEDKYAEVLALVRTLVQRGP